MTPSSSTSTPPTQVGSDLSVLVSQPYRYGFVTDIETEKIAKGLDEDVVRLISAKKQEPEFLLNFRLKAFRTWQRMKEPDWAAIGYPKIDYQILFTMPPQSSSKKRRASMK